MATPPEIATEMVDRFTFAHEVHGTGGFAKVIRGRDTDLERDVAVKVLTLLATEFSETEQERFRREARILASLSHPNIPSIYDVSFRAGKAFLIIFQFIEGSNLRGILNEGPCSISEARVWFHQVASALEHAHGLSIVHRDIKPENIIIRPDRESAYLVDFGIALSAEDARKLTKSGWVIGTPGYMSPEQQAGEPVDASSDVYSLGITLYEALAGKPIPVGDYEPLSAGNEVIPPQIDDLIRDSLLPKERRLKSAKNFSQRLSGALRSSKPLSDVLVHGKLHELATAIEQFSPTEFTQLPKGQQSLILEKVADIAGSGEPNLEYASEQFLELLLNLCILVEKDSYRGIVAQAVPWAFEKEFNGQLGRDSIRRSLERASREALGESYEVLREEFENFLERTELDDQEEWYLHAVRNVLQNLLANPECTSNEATLVKALREVNQIQRSKSQ